MSVNQADHISVIVPVLNEKQNMPKLLEQLRHFSFKQVIIVDGGSDDGSWELLQNYAAESACLAIQSDPGRAKQMNLGAEQATAEYLVFLHADTELPEQAAELIVEDLNYRAWGRFDVAFHERGFALGIIAWFMNWRSRLTGVATGDQVLFIRREVFEQQQGFADIPLMEDVELSKRLLGVSRPACNRVKVKTSARRWLQKGIVKTVLLMWWFRFVYFLGADPHQLAKKYRQIR